MDDGGVRSHSATRATESLAARSCRVDPRRRRGRDEARSAGAAGWNRSQARTPDNCIPAPFLARQHRQAEKSSSDRAILYLDCCEAHHPFAGQTDARQTYPTAGSGVPHRAQRERAQLWHGEAHPRNSPRCSVACGTVGVRAPQCSEARHRAHRGTLSANSSKCRSGPGLS